MTTREKVDDVLAQFKDDSQKAIKDFLTQRDEAIKKLNDELEAIKGRFSEVTTAENTAKKSLEHINKAQDEIDSMHKDMKDAYDSIMKDDGEDLGILSDVKDSQEHITDVYNKISNLYKKIFGYRKKSWVQSTPVECAAITNDDDKKYENGIYYRAEYENIPGLKADIDAMLSEYKEALEAEKKNMQRREEKVDKQNAVLYKKINDLMPGATAVGLSESYDFALKQSQQMIRFWSCVFAGALCACLLIGIILICCGVITFLPNTTFESSFMQIIRVACFELPCVWLAWAANIKVSQYTRLHEEYRHKWTMTRIFDGMRKAIESGEDVDKPTNTGYFYRAILEAFANNPSNTLDKKYVADGPGVFVNRLMDTVAQFTKKSPPSAE